ncbi:hypothetical protein [Liquorilactobacillus cacaonum]|uniref:Polysaccharide polymerase n=1 Tax=Liquorilactobacillus cacaonum DSM 21116 TaxID=1423729 RepID=A0A0R2CSD2_9LACO|nr:hypothetical protein [Liquorilactobacillus cacaonum]KRM92628.1 hypothetical protein FC80_GL001565 [Liquorilactobacillus cacaonum DSM 21116]
MVDNVWNPSRKFLNNKKTPISELLYLSMLTVYIVASAINGTMFVWNSSVGDYTYLVSELSIVGVLIKVIVFDGWDLKSVAVIILSGVTLWQICSTSNESLLFYYFVYIVGAKNVDFKKIIKVFLFSVTIVFLIAVIAALSGFIVNVEQGRTLEPTVRYSLGAVYPTDLASRCFYLLLSYTALRKFKFTIPEYIAALAFTVLIYVVTDTRLDFLLMIAVVLIVIFRNTLFKVIKTLKTGIATSVIFIIILLNIVLAYLFNPDVYVFQIINKLLSGRLTYGHEAFKNYNVPLLGQFVYQNGNGGVHNQPFAYFYIDVSFIRVLMMEGIVAFFVLLVVIYFLYKKFYNGKNYSLLIWLLLAIVSSLIDQHLYELSFNIIFLGLFADLSYWYDDKGKYE